MLLQGLACLDMPPRAKRGPVNKSGVRIHAARYIQALCIQNSHTYLLNVKRELFGGPGPVPLTTDSVRVVASAKTPECAQLQPSSISFKLNRSEMKGSLISTLLDRSYISVPSRRLTDADPPADYLDFVS